VTRSRPSAWTIARAAAALGAALVVACAGETARAPEPPPPSEWPGSVISDRGQLRGQLAPESGPIALNRFQTWTLALRDASGVPVAGAQVAITGGMPAHGHGLPTQPQVTEELGDGRYRIEGVKLNMVGDWVIEVFVRTPRGDDRLRFGLAVDY
jgi:hypothetical protein